MAATSNPLVGIPITEKLSKTNYAMWEAQILAAIHGARLYRHLTGPTPAPSAEIDGEVDGKSCKVPNPVYNEWYATDQQVSGSSSPPSPLPITRGDVSDRRQEDGGNSMVCDLRHVLLTDKSTGGQHTPSARNCPERATDHR